MPRSSHEPTEQSRKQVEALAAYGIPETEIAGIVDADVKVLRRHYGHELNTGASRANLKVAESLFRTALKGGREGTSAGIFWLKTRAGWSEFNAPRRRPPSAKEYAMQEAMTAGVGTDWEGLL